MENVQNKQEMVRNSISFQKEETEMRKGSRQNIKDCLWVKNTSKHLIRDLDEWNGRKRGRNKKKNRES